MPELPEVETVRGILDEKLKNEVIQEIIATYRPILKEDLYEKREMLYGQKILGFSRIGKHLIMHLSHFALIIHLRMEGKFFIKSDEVVDPHEHVIFRFESERELRYHDVRKFGTMHLRTPENYLTTEPIASLGLEPKDLEWDSFYQKIRLRKRPIKAILLDQTIISGLGNIYVDETLFDAKVHPKRLGTSIRKSEAKKIIMSARHILNEAVMEGGTTIRSYTATLGVTGRFQQHLKVHTKQGEACPVCGSTIQKIKVSGRGTYVCIRCQR